MAENTIREKALDPKWERWVLEGGMDIVSHRIVKGTAGARLDRLAEQEYFIVTKPHSTLYHHSLGKISRFYDGLLGKKLYGSRCPRCGFGYLPPRAHCWQPECRLEETEWVQLPLEGTLHTYTILSFAATPFLRELPFILAYVRVDGMNTAIAGRLKDVAPQHVACDMRVSIKFVDQPVGSPLDFYFVPSTTVEPRRSVAERERLENQLKVVEDWVARSFPSSNEGL